MADDEISGQGPSGYIISKPSVDLEMTNNFKPLSSQDAHTHLISLENMLKKLSVFMYNSQDDKELRANALMQNYMLRLGETLNAVVLRNEAQGASNNADVQQDIVIDPSSSGFPLFARDISLLYKDKEQADNILRDIPINKELVEAAIYSSFQKVFPIRQIQQMMQHNYYTTIKNIDLPRPLEVYDPTYVKQNNNWVSYKRSIEKLDDSYNLPRFYTIYYQVPHNASPNGTLSQELKNTIVNDGLQTVVTYELKYLAETLEAIDGVQVQMVQRFDLGPFYNNFTENTAEMKALLEGTSPSEGIISFTKNYVIRESETPIKGFVNRLNALFSGDDMRGKFSDVLSKSYLIMSNKLVQKATQEKMALGNFELIGVTKEGDFV